MNFLLAFALIQVAVYLIQRQEEWLLDLADGLAERLGARDEDIPWFLGRIR